MSDRRCDAATDPTIAAETAGRDVLLVCRDPSWIRAVHDACHDSRVTTTDARGALRGLAGAEPPYSHLLLQAQCDDGLLDTLVLLSSDAAGSNTELILLGSRPAHSRHLTTIRSASTRSVREALMIGPRSTRPPPPDLTLDELRSALDNSHISARY